MNAQGGQYRNPLQAACDNGNTLIVKLLLEKGSEVVSLERVYVDGLEAAHYNNCTDIVELLQAYALPS